MSDRKKLLIVDDDPINIEILTEILEDKYQLHAAYSGQEALDALPEFLPDMVLLDVMMPGISGYDVCERIRADESLKDVIILLVSAKAMPEELQLGYKAGADEYITKPFDHDHLLQQIERFFRG